MSGSPHWLCTSNIRGTLKTFSFPETPSEEMPVGPGKAPSTKGCDAYLGSRTISLDQMSHEGNPVSLLTMSPVASLVPGSG